MIGVLRDLNEQHQRLYLKLETKSVPEART